MLPALLVLFTLVNVADLGTAENEKMERGFAQLASIPAAIKKRHHQFPECLRLDSPAMAGFSRALYARLDDDNELYAIMCEPSAYNFPYAVYIVNNGHMDEAERILFAEYDPAGGWRGSHVIHNPSFDGATRRLSGFSKSRGPGDCGSKVNLAWDGEQFNMIEYRYKDECDGNFSAPFPLIYKSKKARRRR
jgi:hypothetical protein